MLKLNLNKIHTSIKQSSSVPAPARAYTNLIKYLIIIRIEFYKFIYNHNIYNYGIFINIYIYIYN